MSLDELDALADSKPGSPAGPLGGSAATGSATPSSDRSARARRLLGILAAVTAVDWVSKALAWRLLPGEAIINADTSGALPVLRGLVSHPVLGALVDASALVLLVVAAFWLARTTRLGWAVWTGCALVWAGVGSNAMDRWGGHLWLAPGSKRGVVDWIGVSAEASINLADVVIGVGLLLAIAALATARIPRRARAAVIAAAVLLVPLSTLTAGGSAGNAAPRGPARPTLTQQVRASMWVGPEHEGRRVVWRELQPGMNLAVDAVDRNGLVLAQWRLPSDSDVIMLPLPQRTDKVYVTLVDKGWTITLVDNLS